MMTIVKVVSVTYLGGFRLGLRFSDGACGSHDFSAMIERGGSMVVPLRDEQLFASVVIDRGVLTWPNGFDVDSIALHERMLSAGELTQAAAE
jgi:hypothetical protein